MALAPSAFVIGPHSPVPGMEIAVTYMNLRWVKGGSDCYQLCVMAWQTPAPKSR